MTRYQAVDGPIYFGGAVVTNNVIQVAWLRPNIVIASHDSLAGWKALQAGFGAARLVNSVVNIAMEDEE